MIRLSLLMACTVLALATAACSAQGAGPSATPANAFAVNASARHQAQPAELKHIRLARSSLAVRLPPAM
ncbi:hypothetical protein [Sphingomonas sp. C3-2]|uniref:hypothetical protein n=1 Tax=Sphingomonas sp. C3-2 TaxID=3062169 RepID=UPI00294AA134|nr:hypothetical protein [Sphingomonas sp. C3-2]WOK35128.1 hypothetical protein QYC26_08755 [Sphingomonas sp. C3-2]